MPNQRAEGVTPRTVAIPDTLWARVCAVAEDTGRTASAVVRAAVEDYLKRAGVP